MDITLLRTEEVAAADDGDGEVASAAQEDET